LGERVYLQCTPWQIGFVLQIPLFRISNFVLRISGHSPAIGFVLQIATYDIRHTQYETIGFVFSTSIGRSGRSPSVIPAEGAVAEREIAALLRSSQ
jgi:hypothetical protein